MKRFVIALTLLGAPLTARLNAQTSDDAPPPGISSLTITTRIVGVTAVVRDEHGNMVRHLRKDDFALRDSGKTQNIRYFTEDDDLPLMIGLLVDTSGSQRQYFPEQVKASETFLRAMLTRPQDQGYVVRFDTDVLLLQKLTPIIPRLSAALRMLSMKHPPRPGPLPGTLLYDAIAASAQQVSGRERGRRAIIVLTDGEDNGSLATIDQAITLAQSADTAVYTAIYSTRDTTAANRFELEHPELARKRKGLNGRSLMEKVSLATGGRLFVVSPTLTIEQIYKQIEDDMRSQYRFGFVPGSSKPRTYHPLDLTTRDRRFTVQARTGYYTPE